MGMPRIADKPSSWEEAKRLLLYRCEGAWPCQPLHFRLPGWPGQLTTLGRASAGVVLRYWQSWIRKGSPSTPPQPDRTKVQAAIHSLPRIHTGPLSPQRTGRRLQGAWRRDGFQWRGQGVGKPVSRAGYTGTLVEKSALSSRHPKRQVCQGARR